MVGLVGGLFAVSWFVLMKGFTNIEEDFASREPRTRLERSFANELDTLSRHDQRVRRLGPNLCLPPREKSELRKN